MAKIKDMVAKINASWLKLPKPFLFQQLLRETQTVTEKRCGSQLRRWNSFQFAPTNSKIQILDEIYQIKKASHVAKIVAKINALPKIIVILPTRGQNVLVAYDTNSAWPKFWTHDYFSHRGQNAPSMAAWR